MKYYFSSDWHLHHKNIIKYDNRPFISIDEMNKTIIDNHNKIVNKNDVFYYLGDFCLAPYKYIEECISSINGQLHFIKGNHDKRDTIKLYEKYGIYHGMMDEIKINNQEITLNHYRMEVWNKSYHGTWHLYGHSHGSLPYLKHSRCVDVGIMLHNYYPLEFNDIKLIMDTKEWKPIDHHK